MVLEPLSAASRFWRNLKGAFKSFGKHRMMVQAGNMAFIGMLSVFPFLIVLISLSGLMGQTQAGYQSLQFIYDQLPANVVDQIRGPVDLVVSETSVNFLTFSIVIALWTTVRGTAAARSAVMRAYEVKYKKPTHALVGLLIDFGVVFGAVFLILVTLFILVTGPAVIGAIESRLPGNVELAQYWDFSRYVISPMVLFVALFSLYFVFVPRYEKQKMYHAPGALFALLVWFLMAAGFSLYLKYLGVLNLIYGSLTGIIILQLFMFLISIGFLIGAELNAEYTREATRKSGNKVRKSVEN